MKLTVVTNESGFSIQSKSGVFPQCQTDAMQVNVSKGNSNRVILGQAFGCQSVMSSVSRNSKMGTQTILVASPLNTTH